MIRFAHPLFARVFSASLKKVPSARLDVEKRQRALATDLGRTARLIAEKIAGVRP